MRIKKARILDKDNKIIYDAIQSVTWAINRDKAPIYTMGQSRTAPYGDIAGSIIYRPEDKENFPQKGGRIKLAIDFNEERLLGFCFNNVTFLKSSEPNVTLFTCKNENYHLITIESQQAAAYADPFYFSTWEAAVKDQFDINDTLKYIKENKMKALGLDPWGSLKPDDIVSSQQMTDIGAIETWTPTEKRVESIKELKDIQYNIYKDISMGCGKVIGVKKCTCGAEKCGSDKHSDWCDKK